MKRAVSESSRQKKYGRHRKKLEKHEREFWDGNRDICELKPRYTDEELEEQERLNSMLTDGDRGLPE